MKKLHSIIWGIVLIAIGVLFGLNALNITDIDIFFDGWWTLFIIVPCAIGLITEKEKLGNLIGLLIGIVLLLSAQGVIDWGLVLKLAVPAVIVIIGIKLIAGSVFGDKAAKVSKQTVQNGHVPHNSFAAFTGSKVNMQGQNFHGAELNAVFGGIDYDLRDALITEDCVIRATAIFGGIDILLPDNVNVKVSSNSVFGGVSNKRSAAKTENAPTVYINGSGIFGGVDIK